MKYCRAYPLPMKLAPHFFGVEGRWGPYLRRSDVEACMALNTLNHFMKESQSKPFAACDIPSVASPHTRTYTRPPSFPRPYVGRRSSDKRRSRQGKDEPEHSTPSSGVPFTFTSGDCWTHANRHPPIRSIRTIPAMYARDWTRKQRRGNHSARMRTRAPRVVCERHGQLTIRKPPGSSHGVIVRGEEGKASRPFGIIQGLRKLRAVQRRREQREGRIR